MNKKILLTVMLLFIFSVINTTAEDNIKFPGKFNLEYKVQLDSDIIDSQPKQTLNNDNGDLYIRHEAKGKITFRFVTFYKLVPWLKDRVDMKYFTNTAVKSQPDLKFRNRFYIGIDNIFIITDIINICTNFEMRLENRLDKNEMYIRLTPILNLNGSYKFGFSWSMNNLFEFNLMPAVYTDPANDNLFQYFNYELDTFNIQFEFFHYFAPKNIKGSFELDLYILSTHYAGLTRYNKIPEREPMDILNNLKIFAGFNFDFWGINVFFGFYGMFNQYTSPSGGTIAAFGGNRDSSEKSGLFTEFRPGIKIGINLKKEWFECSFQYTGCILGYDSYDTSSNIEDDANEKEDTLNELFINNNNQFYKFWENSISAYIKFKL